MLYSDRLAIARIVMARPSFRRAMAEGLSPADALKVALNAESLGEKGADSLPSRLVDVHAPTGSNKGKGWRGLKPGVNGRHSGSRKHSL